MLNVLVIGFNRSDFIKRQLMMLDKNSLIQSVFLVIDGPRKNNYFDCTQQDDILSWLETFNPSYKLSCLFEKENRGCKKGVEYALDSFFKKFEDGVILEDDCHADPVFFEFFLRAKKYLDDDNVFMLSACSFIKTASPQKIFLSKNPHIWGWATSSKKWNEYRQVTNYYTIWNLIRVISRNSLLENIYFLPKWLQAKWGKIDTWDYDLSFYFRLKKKLCLVPGVNLVKNIGIEGVGAHQIAITDDLSNKEVGLTLKIPQLSVPKLDVRYDKSIISRRLYNKIRKLVTRC
ncbi:hypothetical protein N9E40_04445 [Amylibacter sp.]|nr:hypothetical protein [Amylibacter sp.]